MLGSSDVLKAVIGPEAETAIAVTTVTGAVALALVGAAGVLVLAIRRSGSQYISIGGLLAGSIVAFGAAAGQVWAVTFLLKDAGLHFVFWIVLVAAVLASALLVVYAVTSVIGLLTQGTATKPNEEPLSSPVQTEIAAAAIVAEAIHANGEVTRSKVEALLTDLTTVPERVKGAWVEVNAASTIAEKTQAQLDYAKRVSAEPEKYQLGTEEAQTRVETAQAEADRAWGEANKAFVRAATMERQEAIHVAAAPPSALPLRARSALP